jgi:murein DD-endopeptidase MepM/ murein hydrolase activator NlpD
LFHFISFIKHSSPYFFTNKPHFIITGYILSILYANLAQAQDNWQNYTVTSGDNLSVIFDKIGIPIKEALAISDATEKNKTFARMIPGEKLSFLIEKNSLSKLRYTITPTVSYVITKSIDVNTQNTQYNLAEERTEVTSQIDKSIIKPASNFTQSTAHSNTTNADESLLSLPDSLAFIDSEDYSSVEKLSFIASNNDSLASIIEKTGLSPEHFSYLKNTIGSATLFNDLSANDKLSFLIINSSLLELIYQPVNGPITTFTRAEEFTDTYNSHIQEREKPALPTDLASVLAPKTEHKDNWIYYTVEPGDNLSTLFIKAGLSHSDVYYVDHATKDLKVFNKIKPGQKLSFLIRDNFLINVKYIISPLKSILISRTDKTSYSVETFERTPVIVEKQIEGTITSSLSNDANNAGLSSNLTYRFADIFAWDVDFSQDIQPGDKFKAVYEEKTIDGSKIGDGNIIVGQFDTGGKQLIGIYYQDSKGNGGFYSPQGTSMRKAFLRMPVDFARISSKFNPKRRHPISNTIRAHKGVDYAAKTGTPIKSSGNGKIVHLGRKGGYGRTIIIKHGESINTLYAHMSAYNKKLKVGSRVTQGEVIGYIGSSGAVTGPHLHYEFRVNGVHKNPLTVKLPAALPLKGEELEKFKVVADAALAKLQLSNQIADNQTPEVNTNEQ